jgi:hypothetical protein
MLPVKPITCKIRMKKKKQAPYRNSHRANCNIPLRTVSINAHFSPKARVWYVDRQVQVRVSARFLLLNQHYLPPRKYCFQNLYSCSKANLCYTSYVYLKRNKLTTWKIIDLNPISTKHGSRSVRAHGDSPAPSPSPRIYPLHLPGL